MLKLIPIFRVVAFLEGVSYILLLFIGSPLKWFYGNPKFVKFLGMPHGLLFMLYVVLAIVIAGELKWSKKVLRNVLLASIIPFGTFYIDKKYLKSIDYKNN
jgi:integral membrane protein